MKKIFILFVFVATVIHVQAQSTDTLKILAYNVNNYGDYGGTTCPTQRTFLKSAYLRTVLKYANPDIVGLGKIKSSNTNFLYDTIVYKVLDSVCNGCWGHTWYTNVSGYGKADMVYYKTAQLGFLGTTTMYSGDPNTTDIDLQKFYYKSPSLAATHDTAYLNVILIHDASSSGASVERDTDISEAMKWLSLHVNAPGNFIFMGDFNTQYDYEPCYQAMIAPKDTNIRFYDAVPTANYQGGDWSGKPNLFAQYLTQCTRTVDPGDCASTNGMNQWFDHIMCSNYIMRGYDSIRFVPGSFSVIGQDGKHVNLAIIDSPTNKSVPANVLNAVYQMSEHLPVMGKLAIGRSVDAAYNIPWTPLNFTYNTLVTSTLTLKADMSVAHNANYTLSVYDMTGNLIYKTDYFYQPSYNIALQGLSQGMYIVRVSQDNAPVFNGKFIKI